MFFLPRCKSYQLYGKSVIVKPEFSFRQIEDILQNKKNNIECYDKIRAKVIVAPHFDLEQVELMQTIGFNPMHVYDVQ